MGCPCFRNKETGSEKVKNLLKVMAEGGGRSQAGIWTGRAQRDLGGSSSQRSSARAGCWMRPAALGWMCVERPFSPGESVVWGRRLAFG